MIAHRSPVVELSVRVVTPIAVVVAVFAFFAGHNRPGGGFAAGLLLGAVVVLRTVAGLPQPLRPVPLLSIGAAIAATTALAPILWGDVLLDQVVLDVTLPVLGKIKSGTSAVFDLGVTAIVVGMIVALLDGFGADQLAGPTEHEERTP
jgi:multicomponent Na+:H+ antiporter subunit A